MKQIHSILIVLCAILNLAGSLKLKRDHIGSFYGSNVKCYNSRNVCEKTIEEEHPNETDHYYCSENKFYSKGGYYTRTEYCIKKYSTS